MKKVLLQTLVIFFLSACATIVSPDGGPKDELAPVPLEINPSNFSVNFDSKTIKFVFDEYIKVNNLEAELVSSPPMASPKSIVKGKLLLLTFEDTLKRNTTYTLNFGNAIVDLNEGNPIEDFKYTFSTGSYIDSLSLQGFIKPVYKKELPEKMWLMAYKVDSLWKDSVPYLRKPDYLSRVRNKAFRLDNMSAGIYQLIALEDKNKDYLLNENEFQGFLSKPVSANSDSIILEMDCYQPESRLAFKGVVQKKHDRLDFGFNRTIYKEDSLKISNILEVAENRMLEIEQSNDSAYHWFGIPFDSINILIETVSGKDTVVWFPVKRDTLKPNLSFETSQHLPYKDTMWIRSSHSFDIVNKKKIKLMSDSTELDFELILKRNRVGVVYDFEEETSYLIQVDSNAVQNSNTNYLGNDSLGCVFAMKSLKEYGTLSLTSSDSTACLLELIDAKKKVVKRAEVSQFPFHFKQLLPGKYEIRIIKDINANRRWDSGEYLKRKQPENCSYVKETVEIRANWDLEMVLD